MILLLDKPNGVTSHDVVNIVRKVTHEKRVGHAGTLDPNATGLLIIGVGRESTRQLGEISKNTQKEYLADIFLGEERSTDDPEGEITSENRNIIPDMEEVKQIIKEMIGEQDQEPPIFSAIKLQGKKSYELARSGKKVKLESRRITVYESEIISYEYPLLIVRFKVSSGTYIRSLARDIGRKLGSFAYLKDLRRTKVGKYSIEDATTLDNLPSIIKQ